MRRIVRLGSGLTGLCGLLLLLASLYAPVSAVASVGVPLVESVDADGAIFNGIVTALAEDTQGFIWVGSQFGLLRYDGYRFRRFELRPSPGAVASGVFVRRLWVAPDGRVWVGTNSDGAAVFDPKTERFRHFEVDADDPGQLSNGRVDAFAADGKGGVWIGSDNGLYRWSPGSSALARVEASEAGDAHIRSLLLDRAGALWVGSWNGISRLAPGGDRLERVGEGDSPLVGQEIWALLEDPGGRIWWGSRAIGAGWIEPETDRLEQLKLGGADGLSHPWVSGFALSDDGNLWIGTYGGGVDVIDPQTAQFEQRFQHHPNVDTTVASNTIGALLADRAGLVWIGTWGQGLNHVNANNRAFRMLRSIDDDASSLSYEDVFSVLQLQNGLVWVGTNGNGIDVLDLELGVVDGIRPNPDDPGGLPDGAVIALAQSADGTIWVGTRQSGLLSYDEGSGQFTRWSVDQVGGQAQVQRILVAPERHVWIGTNRGLLRLDPETGKLRTFTTKLAPDATFSGSINPMVIAPDGTLWLGTDTGLYALPPRQDQLLTLLSDNENQESISHNDVNGLVIDATGALWVGTVLGGDRLVAWDGQTARFESINALIGIPPGPLAANMLLDEQGRIWDAGIAIDVAGETRTTFSRADGFDIGGGWIGAYTRTQDGRLLFGGPGGLLIVRPEALQPHNYQPPLVVSTLLVDGKPKPALRAEPLLLTAQVRGFSVEFAALELSSPDGLRYAYQLDGYDPDWIEGSHERRVATFTNLDPGQYTLRVKATNRKGAWSPHQLAYPVIVAAAFHETLWFRSLALVLIALALYGIYLARTRQLAARALHLESVVHERTLSLANANAELAQLARTDPLTGLPNRRAFLESANAELARMRDGGQAFSIALCDVDHFKSFNDRYGHDVGDTVLQSVAAVLAGSVRAGDTVGRWGGEEMIILWPETDVNAAADLSQRCRQAVADSHVVCAGQALQVTLTFGVSCIRPDESIAQCIKRADDALYRGKDEGRNRVVISAA